MSVAISNDNKYVISGSGDKSIKIFDFETKQEIYNIENAHERKLFIQLLFIYSCLDRIMSVAISNDNKYIISGSHDQTMKIFDVETKQEVYHFKNSHKGKPFYPIVIYIFFFRSYNFSGNFE